MRRDRRAARGPAAFFPAATLLAAAAGALAASLGCAPGPAGPPSHGTVLVVSDRAGAWRIYEVDPGEETARLIGSARADDPSYRDTMPARLPDGRIVFVSDRDGNPEIYLATADGGAVARLTRDPGDPAKASRDSDPAPLGRDRIVFARSAPGAPEGAPRDLFVLRLDRPEAIRLTREPGDDGAPQGSPDGRRVVFVSDRGGAPRICALTDLEAPDPEATVVDLSGPARSGPGTPAADGPFADGAPALLPDGSIVFSRAPAGAPPHLFVMSAAGARAGVRQITDSPILPYGADEPVALPDGTILFTAGPFLPAPEDKKAPRFGVYRISAGGINLSRVSRDRAGYDDFTRRLARHR